MDGFIEEIVHFLRLQAYTLHSILLHKQRKSSNFATSNSNDEKSTIMKKIAFILLTCLSSLCSSAQQVWTEGTVWDVIDDENVHWIYSLGSPVDVEGTEYYPLLVEDDNGLVTTEAYIRSERGDSLVYLRSNMHGYLKPNECLLYDFTKSFEYGDIIRYGQYTGLGGSITEELIDENDGEIIYYHDVLETDDVIPSWKGLIYKIGYIEGPMGLFVLPLENSSEEGPRPNPSNLSHLVFTTKGGHRLEHIPNSLELILVDDFLTEDEAYYAADGRKLQDKPIRGMYIHKGKKYILIY